MTKEITKAIILQEIQDKFKLRDFEPENFLFSELVLPTYDIGRHVKHWVTTRHRIEVTGNGSIEMFRVSQTERQTVRRISFIHETGANFEIDQIFFTGRLNAIQYLFYDTTSPILTGTVRIFEHPQDIPMEYDDLYAVYINVANYVAGGYVAVHVTSEVETIR